MSFGNIFIKELSSLAERVGQFLHLALCLRKSPVRSTGQINICTNVNKNVCAKSYL